MKNRIIVLTIFGVLPFYLDKIIFFENFIFDPNELEKIQLFYGALIVSFLSGMQWERSIIRINQLYMNIFPLLNVIWVWSYFFNFLLSPRSIVIIGLIVCLSLDYFFQKKLLSPWFIKLRFFVTSLSILSFYI